MAYTTVSKVRIESGFVGNTNVADETIRNYIARAESEIDSEIGDRYTLPLPTFYKNQIVFSGTGSGSDTLTVTIKGEDYDVAITSGLTASQAADLFRKAAASSSDFVLFEELGAGETVTMYSANQDEDDLDVTITSTDPQTVAGITATGGTVTGVGVKIVEILATGMAAAYLLIQEYGPEAQDTDKDGFKKLALYHKLKVRIQNGEEKLYDYSKTELPTSDTKELTFYPTEASRTDDTDPTANQFTMNELF
jgi:hypothetical protein